MEALMSTIYKVELVTPTTVEGCRQILEKKLNTLDQEGWSCEASLFAQGEFIGALVIAKRFDVNTEDLGEKYGVIRSPLPVVGKPDAPTDPTS
jgi:hypothetical protein